MKEDDRIVFKACKTECIWQNQFKEWNKVSDCLNSTKTIMGLIHSHIGGEDAIDEVLLGQVESALELIVVEGDLSRAGAVEPSLHECGPGVLQEEPSADVVLADPGHAGIDCLATVVLHRILPQEKEGEEADVIG
ncbi:hypothetical protein ILYODFUR_022064 [Ilyodon furcidens]|uniref:Uncharacterized protein n=1 Tax=Ilyodon furcidens TaxID=33524 RepID=A0ABV0U7G6_9TELE